MKTLKKLFSCLGFCIIITVMVGAPVLAQPISSENIYLGSIMCTEIDVSNYVADLELGEKVILPDGGVLTRISKDEYISILAREKNISIQEAYELESGGSKNYLMSNGQIRYIDYSKEFVYSENKKFKAELEATMKVKLWNTGQYAQIEDVMCIGSRRSAWDVDYCCDWVETAAYSDPKMGSSDFPTTSVVLCAKGYFEVVSTEEIDVSVGLPGFVSAGGGSVMNINIYPKL